MAKKARRDDAGYGLTRVQRRKKVPLVADGLSPLNRARALIRLRELERHYNEVGERVKGRYADPDDHIDDDLQTDLLDLAATKQAVRSLAAQVNVRPGEQTEDTLKLIGEALDGAHRQGKRRE